MDRLREIRHMAALAGLFLLVAGSSGCTLGGLGGPTPPSRFYLLASLEEATGANDGPVLGVGPVRLAEYLDRPQMVTRRGPHALHLAEYDRWAEPLSDSISRVVAADLGALLRTERVRRHPWRDGRSVQVQVELDVLRLDGPAEGPVALEVLWRLGQGGRVQDHVTRHREPLEGRGYEAYAAAISRALQVLAREVAAAATP